MQPVRSPQHGNGRLSATFCGGKWEAFPVQINDIILISCSFARLPHSEQNVFVKFISHQLRDRQNRIRARQRAISELNAFAFCAEVRPPSVL